MAVTSSWSSERLAILAEADKFYRTRLQRGYRAAERGEAVAGKSRRAVSLARKVARQG